MYFLSFFLIMNEVKNVPRKTFKNIITSEDKLKKINPKNVKLANMFLNNLKKNHSDGTVKVYKSNFNIFFVWNLENNDNKFFVDLRKIELNEFFDYCVAELKYNSARTFVSMPAVDVGSAFFILSPVMLESRSSDLSFKLGKTGSFRISFNIFSALSRLKVM